MRRFTRYLLLSLVAATTVAAFGSQVRAFCGQEPPKQSGGLAKMFGHLDLSLGETVAANLVSLANGCELRAGFCTNVQVILAAVKKSGSAEEVGSFETTITCENCPNACAPFVCRLEGPPGNPVEVCEEKLDVALDSEMAQCAFVALLPEVVTVFGGEDGGVKEEQHLKVLLTTGPDGMQQIVQTSDLILNVQ